MSIIINGDTGVSGVDGSASTPAYQGNDTNTGIFYPAADTIAFAEGGIESMRLDSSGNVGIGTTSPSAGVKLHVSSSSDNIILSSGGSGAAGYLVANGNARSGLTGALKMFSYSSGVAEITNASNAAMTFGTNDTERMRITSAGGISFGSSGTNFGTSGQILQSAGDAPPTWGEGPVGVGQTWQNVIGSRAAGTTYTNSTGKAIQVVVTAQVTGNNTSGNSTATVSGVTVARMIANNNNASYTTATPLSFIVPNGGTYSITNVGAPTTIIFWAELR